MSINSSGTWTGTGGDIDLSGHRSAAKDQEEEEEEEEERSPIGKWITSRWGARLLAAGPALAAAAAAAAG
jgi:hypothetical protein